MPSLIISTLIVLYCFSCKIGPLVRGRTAFDGRKLVSLKRLKYGCDLYYLLILSINVLSFLLIYVGKVILGMNPKDIRFSNKALHLVSELIFKKILVVVATYVRL